jgi:hypothetical protein
LSKQAPLTNRHPTNTNPEARPDERPLRMISGRELTHSRSENSPSKGNTMNDPKDEAKQLFKQPKPKAPPTVSEYEAEQQAIRDNFEWLKQQRREREAVAST